MTGAIFIKKKPNETLDRFRESFCAALGVQPGEQRFSDNYADGTYFRTDSLGVRVLLEIADDSEFPEYDFYVHNRPRISRSLAVQMKDVLEGIADLVAMELAAIGYNVLRVSENLGDPNGKRVRRRCMVAEPGSVPRFAEE